MFSRSKRQTIAVFSTAGIAFFGTLTIFLLMGSQSPALAAPEANSGPPPTIQLEVYAEGFVLPTALTNAGVSGDIRLFVAEQGGTVRIISGTNNLLPTPFLSITNRVHDDSYEQGLLGLAFHPNYESNGYFYVNYTYVGDGDEDPGDTRISRFQVSAGDPNQADPNSEVIILKIPQPGANHNAGDLAFGPDGYLYIPTGDGGNNATAQDLSTMLGKILRIDIDTTTPYTVPPGNPYTSTLGALEEIWASGLRNPWRFSFDRANGDLYIGDVGAGSFEEVNFQVAASTGGENYGWRCYEGNSPYDTTGCGPLTDYDFPVFVYSHAIGRVVVGGYVYRGADYPGMTGHYFFADFSDGKLWSMINQGSGWSVKPQGVYPGSSFSTFGEDINGELYLANFNLPPTSIGVVHKLVNLPNNLFLPITIKSGS